MSYLLVMNGAGVTIWWGLAYVGPGYEVVGCFSESLHDWVFHHFVWDVESVRVLDESPAWFTSAGIPTHCDVRVEVRYDPIPTILRLDRDGLEEEVHSGHETLLGAGTTLFDKTFPVAMHQVGQFSVRSKKMVGGSYSLVRVETRESLSWASGQYRVFITSSAILRVPRWVMSSERSSR